MKLKVLCLVPILLIASIFLITGCGRTKPLGTVGSTVTLTNQEIKERALAENGVLILTLFDKSKNNEYSAFFDPDIEVPGKDSHGILDHLSEGVDIGNSISVKLVLEETSQGYKIIDVLD